MKQLEEGSEPPGIGMEPRAQSTHTCCSLPSKEVVEAESGEDIVPIMSKDEGLTDTRSTSSSSDGGESQGSSENVESTPRGGLPNSWRGSMRKERIDISPLVPGGIQGQEIVSKSPRGRTYGMVVMENYFGDGEESTESETDGDRRHQPDRVLEGRREHQSPASPADLSPRALRVDTRRGPQKVDIVPTKLAENEICNSRCSDSEEEGHEKEISGEDAEERAAAVAESTKSNSPQAPRDIWERDEVFIVPTNEAISKSDLEETGDTEESRETDKSGDQPEGRREALRKGEDKLSKSLHKGRTLLQYQSSPRKSTKATMTPDRTRKKKDEKVKRETFYRRRQKGKVRRKALKRENRIENAAKYISRRIRTSAISWEHKSREVTASRDNAMNNSNFEKSMSEIISQTVAEAQASGQVKERADKTDEAGPSKENNDLSRELDKLAKELLPTQSSEEDESLTSQPEVKKKGRKPRKEFKCEVDGCGFVATWKTRMENHKKKAHNGEPEKKRKVNLGRKGGESAETSPELMERTEARTPAGKRKAEGSPSGGVSTKKLKEAIREQLEKAQKADKEEKSKVVTKGIPSKKSEEENLTEAYRKIQHKDEMIGKMDQEIIEAKAKLASAEMALKAERLEKESWRENCGLLLEMQEKGEDNGVHAEKVKGMEKKIEELKEEAAKWKGITTAQYAALTDVTKRSIESAERVKFMQSNIPCKDYLRGHCKRGKECRYGHGDVNTMLRAGVRGAMNAEEKNRSPRAGNGKEYCAHFESGYCRYGSDCWKEHDPARYGTRPRSGSHGNQGFRGPAKPTPAVLGGIREYPEMREPMEGQGVKEAKIQEMEEVAKKYGASERAMVDQMNFLVEHQLIPGGGVVEEIRKKLAPKRQLPKGY